jgi:septal ring factor EnvC (AmiA/AmiB activator)
MSATICRHSGCGNTEVGGGKEEQNKNTEKLTTMKKQIILTIGLATLLVTGTQATQEQLAASIKDVRAETARTHDQLKATLGALNALTKQTQGDLRPAYNTYCAEVTKTEAAAGWTRTRAQWMANDGRKYFESWQKTIDGMANPSLHKKAQKRLNSVQASYGKVEGSLRQAGEKFKPFLSDLGDIQKALATDVTAGGVKALRGTVNSANWNHQYISKAVDSALKEMQKMEKSLSAQAK